MPESPLTLPEKQHIRLKVLLPMSIGLLIFIGLFVASTSWYLNRKIYRDLSQNISNIDTMFHSLLDQRAEMMKIQLEQLANNPHLQQLIIAKDREQLYKATEPVYQALHRHMNISHFVFYSPEKAVFLRVNNPQHFGDRTVRSTLQQAAKTGKTAVGMELGPLGSFTLKLATPWILDGKLIGYLELGQEIKQLINQFFTQQNTELILTINKDQLIREDWEARARSLGKESDWNLLANKVIVQMTKPEMIGVLRNIIDQDYHPAQIIKVEFDDRQYQGLSLPLFDATHRQIGEFLMLNDLTEEVTDYHNGVQFFIALCLFFGGGFLYFASMVLGKTEDQLEFARIKLLDEMQKVKETNSQLETEIEERKAVEVALSKAHDELEARVQERTEQLWLSLEQTRQARKQLTGVVTSVSDGLIVTDLDGNLQLINTSAEALFNCHADECNGQPLKTIIKDPALLKRMEDALAQQLADLRIEFSQMSQDLQKTLFFQARTSVISGNQGEVAGMIFLIQDISHEREMDRIKSEFISTAVHELSTPLTAIMGYSELLLSGQQFQPEENHEFLSIINEKAEFLTSLVSDMLDISRIESGRPLDLKKTSISAEELFERPIHHFRHFSKNHHFSVDIAESQLQLTVDREKIWQVMENLCSNAVKYSPAGGEIKVSGQPYENGYQVTITDHGIGMTKEQLPRVFEKFYRCNQSNTAVGGTGLGMTIVKSIIEAHDGQIWLESELGQGTSVHFILPCS